MPSLQTSSTSAPSFSLSPSGIVVLVVMAVLVFGGWAVYFVVLPFASRKIEERRARVSDAESSTTGVIVYPAEKVKKAAAALVLARARATLNPTIQRSVVMPSPKRSPTVVSSRHLPHLVDSLHVSTRFSASRTRTRPGPSPLRASVLAPEAPSKDDPAADLVKARIQLAVNSKAAVIGKSPFGPQYKSIATRPHLQPIAVNEVPASFATTRTHVRHGPSPLSSVFPAHEPEPVATTATDVEASSIAHALAGLFASVYHAEDDAESDDDEDPFEFDLDRAVPAPAPIDVAVITPPLDIPTIIVESPSLTIGDGSKSTSRKRSNSFIGWRQGHTPSKGTGRSGTQGSSSREKENDGFLRVPSPSRHARPRPRRPRA